MRLLLPALLALASAPLLAAEKNDKPLGRSTGERFASPTKQQDWVFDTRQGSVGGGRSFNAGAARTKEFNFSQRYSPAKYETAEFSPPKKSWLGNFKFATKAADTKSKSVIPNTTTTAPTKTAATKGARDTAKTVAVRELPDGGRQYLGPESKKLDKAVDPGKPLPGWTGDKMEVLSLEQVRELLNKNK